MVQTILMTVEMPQVQFIDTVVNLFVTMQRHIRTVQGDAWNSRGPPESIH